MTAVVATVVVAGVVAGIGCRRGTDADAIVTVLRAAESLADVRVTALAAPAFKSGEAGLVDAAGRLGLDLMLIDDAALAAVQAMCPTRSGVAHAHTGFASVAEAAALASCGAGATLLLPRLAHARATCALAAPGRVS